MDKSEVSLVSSFHCMSTYWSPAQGSPEREVSVKFREAGQQQWREGHPLRYHPIEAPECRADYRGSLVNLTPATTYDIVLTLDGTDLQAESSGTTWSEDFSVRSTVKVSDRETTLTVSESGAPDAYVLYDGTGCTIDPGNKEDVGIAVNASYVILRGFTIRNVREHGIRLFSGHHIVIEDCDISTGVAATRSAGGNPRPPSPVSRHHSVPFVWLLVHSGRITPRLIRGYLPSPASGLFADPFPVSADAPGGMNRARTPNCILPVPRS